MHRKIKRKHTKMSCNNEKFRAKRTVKTGEEEKGKETKNQDTLRERRSDGRR